MGEPSNVIRVNDFYHPVSCEPQRIVGMSRVELGLSAGDVMASIDEDVDANDSQR